MKKLALAPAVALAITGLAASPVMAAPTASTQAAQPASQTGALQKASASSQNDAEPQAGDIAVSEDSVTIEDFAENGVGIAGTDLAPETEYKIVIAPADDQNVDTYTTSETTDENGAFETAVAGVGEPNPAFIGEYSVTVTNTDDSEDTATTSFEVTGEAEETDEPEAPAVDPKVSLNTEKITASDFEKDGLKVTGEGFTPGSTVNVMGNAAQSPFYQDEVKADEDGKISTTVKAPEDGLEPGDYSVSAFDAETEEVSNHAKFTVTEDETEEARPTTPATEATLTVSPETIEAADFVVKNKGVALAVENCEPGSDVHYVVTPKGSSNVTAYDNTVKADDEGKASVNVYGTSANDASAYLGDYDVTVTCGDDEMTGAFTVGEDANAGGSDGNDDANEDGNSDDGNGGSELPRTGTELTGLVGGAALLLIGGAAVTMTVRRKKGSKDPSDV